MSWSGLILPLITAFPLAAAQMAPQANSTFAQEMVAAHNAIRADVGVPPLTWNPVLADEAQSWARSLMMRRTFEHSLSRDRHGEGENLVAVYGEAVGEQVLTNRWTVEKASYAYGPLHCDESFHTIGHYTQMVWKSTTSVGCGLATDGHDQVMVCRYAPAGNICGERPY